EMDEELGPDEVMIESEVGKEGEAGSMCVVLRRIIPLTVKEIIERYGEEAVAYMLRESIRSRIQKKAYRLLQAVVKGKAQEGQKTDVEISNYMATWNPPDPEEMLRKKSKEERLVADVEKNFDNLDDAQAKRLLDLVKARARANKAAADAAKKQ
ncbi:unnamed protein product, partial [marine sediment metagenome]